MHSVRAAAAIVTLLVTASVHAQEIIRTYGPGGPAPAMREAAEAFGKANGVRVEVMAGPTDAWIARAREDADVIYSGAEYIRGGAHQARPEATAGCELRGVPPVAEGGGHLREVGLDDTLTLPDFTLLAPS